jgi:hypothetical protein
LSLEVFLHSLPFFLFFLYQKVHEGVVLTTIPMVKHLHELVMSHLLPEVVIICLIDFGADFFGFNLHLSSFLVPFTDVVIAIV